MLNRIHSPQDCLSSLWDKSFLQERGIASFFLTEKNTFENTPLFDGIFRYLLIQKGTAQITITGLEYFPQSAIVLTDGLDQSIDAANAYAAEHLEIQTKDV